ncbi:hypothetical protein B0J14DRAFT_643404 [Halenospora varia]|nr:hypothetical protein B0J14DRAFT_643404 [Halenospora varia]
MHFQITSLTSIAVALLVTTAVSAPTKVEPRTAAGLITARLCNGAKLSGFCQDITINSQTTCFNLKDVPDLNKRVISISVPVRTGCRLWKGGNCTGGSTPDIYTLGNNQLHDLRFGNVSGSFKCYRTG